MVVRTYARIVGLILVVAGLGGLFYLPRLFFIPDLSLGESCFHLATGTIFAYLGFFQPDEEVIRPVVGGLGVLLLLGKGTIISTGLLWGEAHLFGPTEITCIVFGITSVLAAKYLRYGASGED